MRIRLQLSGCTFLLLFVFVVCLPPVYGLSASSSAAASNAFKLRRTRSLPLDKLRAHDRLRHARHLVASVHSYPLYRGDGAFYAEVQIGTPPSTYYAQVDTGSDLLWLNCGSCTDCPTSSPLNVPLKLYAPESSSTSSVVGCADAICPQPCSSSDNKTACRYAFAYGSGMSTGYLVEDILQLNLGTGNQPASAAIKFGCATTPDPALLFLDGILGLGPSSSSIISQLISLNVAPPVFAHCLDLRSMDSSGGTLVIGNVQATGLVYTPIVENPDHYNVNLLSISLNGQTIPVNSKVSPSDTLDTGTVVDSGTTLAYFPGPVLGELLTGIFGAPGFECAHYSGSVNDGFPNMTLTFEGPGSGSIMVIQPEIYLSPTNEKNTYCVAFGNSMEELNNNIILLGDIILGNKLVVYDLGKQQIGWVDYDCSSSVTLEP